MNRKWDGICLLILYTGLFVVYGLSLFLWMHYRYEISLNVSFYQYVQILAILIQTGISGIIFLYFFISIFMVNKQKGYLILFSIGALTVFWIFFSYLSGINANFYFISWNQGKLLLYNLYWLGLFLLCYGSFFAGWIIGNKNEKKQNNSYIVTLIGFSLSLLSSVFYFIFYLIRPFGHAEGEPVNIFDLLHTFGNVISICITLSGIILMKKGRLGTTVILLFFGFSTFIVGIYSYLTEYALYKKGLQYLSEATEPAVYWFLVSLLIFFALFMYRRVVKKVTIKEEDEVDIQLE